MVGHLHPMTTESRERELAHRISFHMDLALVHFTVRMIKALLSLP
uniref:Uncharacterized protein n=1 Tax=Picea glauca TaxID=3330 RepID=A0A117NG05_PICGL|nr:hypothetical protein ABT39_MTgene2161 [Picea glauca]QHR87207.1 hypothetical protein Q903MT_gene1216 [Picea sitchensis]